MSLHRNDFLVSAHHAEAQRHAADARIARAAMAASSSRTERKPGLRARAITGLVAAIRPVSRAAADAVKAPTLTTPATGAARP